MTTTNTHEPPVSDARPAFPWTILLSLSLGTFVTVTSETLPAGLMLELSGDLGVTTSTTSLLVSVWAVTIAVTSLPLVRLTVRARRRTLLWLTQAVMAVATLGTALAPGLGAALASRVVAASAHGLFWSVVMAYALSVVGDRLAGRAVSVVVGGATLAGVLGLPLGTALGTHLGWRAAFLLVAALMAVTALLLARVLPSEPDPVRQDGAGTMRWDTSARSVLVLGSLGMLVVLGHFAVYTFVSELLTRVGGFAEGSVAALLFAFGAAGAVGLAPAGFVADRWPRGGVAVAAVVFAGSVVSLMLLGRSVGASVAVVALWGAMFGIFIPLVQTRVLRVASDAFRPAASALLVIGFNGAFASGSFVGGRTLDSVGVDRLVPVFAVLMGVAALGLTLYTVSAGRASARTP